MAYFLAEHFINEYIPPSWSNGTDAEIIEALNKHYAGEINLWNYWSVGDERTIHLNAMTATGVGESHVAQDVTFVIMNIGGKSFRDFKNECAFIVGVKDVLKNNGTSEDGYINSTATKTNGWSASARRTWCNETFRNAIPSSIRSIFKEHVNYQGNGTSLSQNTYDYFALPSIKEVIGSYVNAYEEGETRNTQFEWYKTKANGKKSVSYWTRSSSTSSNAFCIVNTNNDNPSSGAQYANKTYAISPFGCI